jgi:CRP/FNR family cyclic AMP-dependent transcriptional regulator
VADAAGHEVVLSTMGPGEYFGEMALDRRPRSASIMTLVPSRFLIVPATNSANSSPGIRRSRSAWSKS